MGQQLCQGGVQGGPAVGVRVDGFGRQPAVEDAHPHADVVGADHGQPARAQPHRVRRIGLILVAGHAGGAGEPGDVGLAGVGAAHHAVLGTL
jgi:hypothetical protein